MTYGTPPGPLFQTMSDKFSTVAFSFISLKIR